MVLGWGAVYFNLFKRIPFNAIRKYVHSMAYALLLVIMLVNGVRLLESVLSLESKKLLVLRLVARSRTSLKVRATPPQPHIHSESF